jgi:hypothetical protein
VTGGRLRTGEIEDVAEDAADRRAHQMDDAETGFCHTHEPDDGRTMGATTRGKFASIVHGRP